ncbi:glucose-6-phosphate dehydrogenase [Acidaminobacter hydrogenoformans]|uniref:Glucose-6-phosphate 1-dehydrogenase n=1 Tax=Acidaminobacter hydrogenoformans DSM 2784 TaxID=1120920 RepID=A0A1G5RUT1_9FIRM|nr:glucose-6-phosphate dehydrogenase [Acidaminobacter hydrogenoformans]SCZ77667.1 glucose-6-phosphate 1-dehydrogenase [Acidaminobacter hydrogenoformans DSM 2784]
MDYIWIFGVTGDLSRRKLLPALAKLLQDGRELVIVGISRKQVRQSVFRAYVEKTCESVCEVSLNGLLDRLFYVQMDFDHLEEPEDPAVISAEKSLADIKAELEEIYGAPSRSLFILATMPEHFGRLARTIRGSDIAEEGTAAILIEKPFGYDLASAVEYNERISRYFDESAIFRIDHYLGKAMLRNLFSLRFSNAIFDAVWCKDYIEEVNLYALETLGIEGRGGYYDKAGALRDMVQSHMLQMAALVAMDAPEDLGTEAVRRSKIQSLRQMKLNLEESQFGQYTGSESENGFLDEEGVAPDSGTETFASLMLEIDAPRWQGVPFKLVTGKKLSEKKTVIEIKMKAAKLADQMDGVVTPNSIEINVQPEEGVRIRFNVLAPSSEAEIVERELDYCQSCLIGEKSPEAYEKLLIDALKGDLTLFASWGEIEAAWELVDPAVAYVRAHPERLLRYEAGRDVLGRV